MEFLFHELRKGQAVCSVRIHMLMNKHPSIGFPSADSLSFIPNFDFVFFSLLIKLSLISS